MRQRALATGAILALALGVVRLTAHSGPPFPIVTDQLAGAYSVSIWTDPDATDDGSPGGQFWVMLRPSGRAGEVPAGTQVTVAVKARDRANAPKISAHATPVDGAIGRQFAAVLMDHEGPFGVLVVIEGPLGPATVTSETDATYDLRPPPALFVVYLLPFVAIGLLWMRVLWKRRGLRRPVHSRSKA